MAPWPVITLAGVGIGLLMGFFGVGGSSVATPILAILGVPGLAAVASPLPATIPSAAVGAIPYLRRGEARPKAAAWTLLGAMPATVVGALLSHVRRRCPHRRAVMLVAVGVRVIRPIDDRSRVREPRRLNRPLLVAGAAGVGLFTGLFANGGGFLLMPLYLLVFGLRMRQAVGTSLSAPVVAVLSVSDAGDALGPRPHRLGRSAAVFAAGMSRQHRGRPAGQAGRGGRRRPAGLRLVPHRLRAVFTAYRLLR